MKLLLLLGCLAFAVAIENTYSLTGGFKELGRYVYRYDAFVNPAQLPDLENQFTKLHLKGEIELHFLRNDKVILRILELNILECYSDPKIMGKVFEKPSVVAQRLAVPELKKEIAFIYRGGMVLRVLALRNDPDWSVNMKKSILNLIHVDLAGKDPKTGSRDVFVKEEVSILGICPTTYSRKELSIVDVRQVRKPIGLEITKSVQYEKCTGLKYDVVNKVVQGTNPDVEANPLKVSATIKQKLIGAANRLKIEKVTAEGLYVLFPFTKQQEGIVSKSVQTLELIKEGGSTIEIEKPTLCATLIPHSTLIMTLPNFHKPDLVPLMTPAQIEKKAIHIHGIIRKFVTLIPKETPVVSVTLVPEMSVILLELVNHVRELDAKSLEIVWQKCAEPTERKWLVYALSLGQTEASLELIIVKLPLLSRELILDILQGFGFAGKPTKVMIAKMQQICTMPKIQADPILAQACWISASNIAKGYCKVNPICTSWVETEILKALEKIPTRVCLANVVKCQPIQHLPVLTVLAIAQNLGRPSLLTPLEAIILHPLAPVHVKVHTINCIRPITRVAPNRAHIVLLRLFRDVQYDIQLRALAVSVLMEQPHPRVIHIVARHLLTEPSVNIRKFVHEALTETSKSLIVKRAIRHACKVVLSMYEKLFLPSKLPTYRSQFIGLRANIAPLNVAAEVEASMIADKKSYTPRFTQSRVKLSVLGRKLELLDVQVYMQGVQDYINYIASLAQPKVETVQEVNQKTRQVLKDPEELILEAQVKIFDKLVNIQQITLEKTTGYIQHFLTKLPGILKVVKQLKEGKPWILFKPIIPVEVIYTVPTLTGLPLIYNMESVVIPHVKSELRLEMHPDPTKPSFWMQRQKLETIKVAGAEHINVLAEVKGRIAIRLPFLEVGAIARKVMRVSVESRGMVSHNFLTGEHQQKIVLPKTVEEVVVVKTTAAHFVKLNLEPSREIVIEPNQIGKTGMKVMHEPIEKIAIEPDQLGKVQIINVNQPCVGRCRSEEWIIRTQDGKYLSVHGTTVVLSRHPYTFKVLFHGTNRRIISLYAPLVGGYVTLSRRSPKPTLLVAERHTSGKFFIVDFDNMRNTVIKSLVHLETTPKEWPLPTLAELEEIRKVEALLMKEEVQIHAEQYVEKTELAPTQGKLRLTYLTVTAAGEAAVSPKPSEALRVTVPRKTKLTTLLTKLANVNGLCIGKPWGIKLCVRGYMPEEITRSVLHLLIAPMELKVTLQKDTVNSVEVIKTTGRIMTQTSGFIRYELKTELVGPLATKKNIKVVFTMDKRSNKINIIVVPSHVDLLKVEKLCYREHFLPDGHSLSISAHPQCTVNHVKIDFIAPKKFPRHQMAFKIAYTTQGLPLLWRQVLTILSRTVVLPVLRNTMTSFVKVNGINLLPLEKPIAPITGTAYVKLFLTRKDTMNVRIEAPTETFVLKDIRINAYIKSFPIGSRTIPLIAKLYWSQGKALCQHKGSTFITFDKVVYKYPLTRPCAHVLLRSCYKNMPQLMVLLKKIGGVGSSLKRVVSTVVGGFEIDFIPRGSYQSKPIVKINKRELVFNLEHIIMIAGKPAIYIVWEPQLRSIGLWHVETGLWVSLRNGFKVQTSISKQFFSRVCGLCGDYNGEPKNEFLTPEGKLIVDVQKPKLIDEKLKAYQGALFGSSWIVPGRRCVREGCKFNRENIQVLIPGKFCLTSIKVPQCLRGCQVGATETIKVPATCVAWKEKTQLGLLMSQGRRINLLTVREHLVSVRLPTKCVCPCGDRYQHYDETKGEIDRTSIATHWWQNYQNVFNEY